MNFDLTGRKAIICGGSRGIGRAVALGMAAAGADVSICARGAETLEATRKEITAFGHNAHAASVHLGNQDAVKSYIAHAATALGGIDVLVNNASAFGSDDDEAAWVASLAIDLLAIVHATQVALPFLHESKDAWSTRPRSRHFAPPRGGRLMARSRPLPSTKPTPRRRCTQAAGSG